MQSSFLLSLNWIIRCLRFFWCWRQWFLLWVQRRKRFRPVCSRFEAIYRRFWVILRWYLKGWRVSLAFDWVWVRGRCWAGYLRWGRRCCFSWGYSRDIFLWRWLIILGIWSDCFTFWRQLVFRYVIIFVRFVLFSFFLFFSFLLFLFCFWVRSIFRGWMGVVVRSSLDRWFWGLSVCGFVFFICDLSGDIIIWS